MDASLSASIANVQAQLSDALQVPTADAIDIPVTIDESGLQQAQADLDALSQSAQDATTSVDGLDTAASSSDGLATLSSNAESASSNVDALSQASTGLGAAVGVATGSTGELKGAVGELGGAAAGAAVGGIAALGAGFYELFQAGLEDTSALQRFNMILGDMADKVNQVHVGDLNTTLDELAKKLGSDQSAMQTAVATLYQFAINAGASKDAAAQFSDNIYSLAARAVALNPALGDVSDVAVRMEVGLGRARSASQQFGIAISQAEINTRAMKDTGKQSAAELTAYEKSVAGAEIALQRYGTTLNETVAQGSENAAIKQRQFKAALQEMLEKLGQPLVAPMFDVMQAALPTVEALGQVLSALGQSVLPVVAGALEAAAVPMQALADVLSFLAPAIGPVVAGFLAFEAVQIIPTLMLDVAIALETVATVAPIAGGSMLAAMEEMVAASAAVEASMGPIGWIAAGLGVAAAAFGLFSTSTDTSTQSVSDFGNAVKDANGQLDDAATKAALKILDERNQVDDLAKSGLVLKDVLSTVGDVGKKGADSLTGMKDAMVKAETQTRQSGNAYDFVTAAADKWIAKIRESNPALAAMLQQLQTHGQLNAGLIGTLADLAGQYGNATQKAKELGDIQSTGGSAVEVLNTALSTSKGSLDAFASGTGDAASASKDLDAAVQTLTTDLDLLLGRFLDGDQAQLKFQDTMASLDQQLYASAFNFDTLTEAGRKNKEALDAAGQQAISTSAAILKSGGTVEDALAPLESYRQKLEDLKAVLKSQGVDTSALDVIEKNVDTAIENIRGKTPAAQDAGTALGKAIVAGAGSTQPDHAGIGSTLGGALVGGIQSVSGAAGTAGTGLGHASTQGAGSTAGDHQSTGSTLGRAVGTGLTSVEGVVRQAGVDVAQQGHDGAASVGGWDAIGAAAAEGIAAGIGSHVGSIVGAAVSAVGSAVASAKSAAAIKSPSRVFAEQVGRPMAEGMAVGIEEAAGEVAKAAVAAVDQAMGAAASAIAAAVPTLAVGDQSLIPKGADTATASQALAAIAAGGDQTAILSQISGMITQANLNQDAATAQLLAVIATNFRDEAQFATSATQGVAYLQALALALSQAPVAAPAAGGLAPVATGGVASTPATDSTKVQTVNANIDWKPVLDALTTLDKDVKDGSTNEVSATQDVGRTLSVLLATVLNAASSSPAATIGSL